jgi:TP901 family phage tail tape measure protein
MALLGTLQVRLGLDTGVFNNHLNKFANSLEAKVAKFQRGLSGLTNLHSLMGGAALTAGLAQGINAAGQYEAVMLRVGAAAEATTGQMSGLSDWILKQSENSIYSATAMGEAAEELAKAGQTLPQIMSGGLVGTLQLAAAEGMEMAEAASMITNTLGAFSLKAEEAGSVADALAGAAAASQASVRGLGQSFSQSAANAALVGMNYQELAGTLALMAKNGIQGSDAGTSVKTMLLRLVPATDQAKEAMRSLGINFTNADGTLKNITQVADILRERLGKLTDAQRQTALQTIFGTDAFRAAAILYKDTTGDLENFINAAKDTEAAERMAESRTTGWIAALQKLRVAISGTFIEMTNRQGGLAWLTDGANKLREFIVSLKEAPPWLTKLSLGLAAGAAALPFLAAGLSAVAGALPILVKGLALATGPWGAAIVGAIAVWANFKDEIISGINSVRQWFAGWMGDNQATLAALGDAWTTFTATLAPLWESIKIAAGTVAQAIAKAFGTETSATWETFKALAASALTATVQAITSLITHATALTTWLTANLPAAAQKVVDFGTQAVQWFRSVGDYLQTRLGPTFESWKNGVVAVFGFVRAALQLWWEVFSQTWTMIGAKLAEFADWISKTTAFKVSIDLLKAAFELWGQAAKKWLDLVLTSLGTLYDKGAKFLTGLTDKIDSARRALNLFGDAGEKETDRAVGNSWLTDLCEKGVANFRNLIGLGIDPAADAIKRFGSTGKRIQGTFDNPLRAQAVTAADIRAHQMGVRFRSDAGEFENAWSIATRNTQNAFDQLVREGSFSFKTLINSIIADFASAQLSKAVKAMFSGLSSSISGGGGSGGGWGSIITSVIGAFGSFDGGGYTGNAPRSGGLDGKGGRLAMLHPRETVIDHTKVARSARPSEKAINLTVPITLQPGVSHQELALILPEVQTNLINTLIRNIERGGRLASSFGM